MYVLKGCIQRSDFRGDTVCRTLNLIVIPAKVGMRNILELLDSGFRPNDGKYSSLPDSGRILKALPDIREIKKPDEIHSSGHNYKMMERETGFEPATSTLARLHSTTELFPLSCFFDDKIAFKKMEAASGFEPENSGFADRCLATWLCRRLIGAGNGI